MDLIVPRPLLTPIASPDPRATPRIEPGVKVLRASEARAVWDADAIVARAHDEAQAIVAASKQAYEEERRRGYADGLEAARRVEAEAMVDQVAQGVEFLGQVEGRLVDLVMQGVRKIVMGFDDRELVVITVRNLLEVARSQRQLTLRLNPDQAPAVRDRVQALLAHYPGVQFLDIVADARLDAGTCLLESQVGLVQASPESQLSALQAAFDKTLGKRP